MSELRCSPRVTAGSRDSSLAYTLIELIVALAIAGLVGTAAVRLLAATARGYRALGERVEAHSVLRAALLLVPSELRELGTGDQAGSDLLALWPDSVEYRATRSVRFLCGVLTGSDSTKVTVVVREAPVYGPREIEAGDGVLAWRAPGSVSRPATWAAAAATGVNPAPCPDGASGLAIEATTPAAANAMAGLVSWSPVRVFERARLVAYRDGSGDNWLGIRRFDIGTGRPRGGVEPFLGPVAPGGLRFRYFDRDDRPATSPAEVARIEVMLVALANDRVDSVTVQVALRNTPSP